MGRGCCFDGPLYWIGAGIRGGLFGASRYLDPGGLFFPRAALKMQIGIQRTFDSLCFQFSDSMGAPRSH